MISTLIINSSKYQELQLLNYIQIIHLMRVFSSDILLWQRRCYGNTWRTGICGKKVKYAWGDLKADRQLQEQYAIEIRNRFHVLQEEKEDEKASETYQRFVIANQQAAETCLKQIKKVRQKEHSSDPKVTIARKEMKTAYTSFITDKGEDSKKREEYARKKENVTVHMHFWKSTNSITRSSSMTSLGESPPSL